MEQFKKTRSDRTKNNISRSLSPYDGISPRSAVSNKESHTSVESTVNTTDVLRRTFSENDLNKKSYEKEYSPFRATEERLLREKFHDLLKEKKEGLEVRSESLKGSIRRCLDKYAKQRVFKLFHQELHELFQKSKQQLEQKYQEQVDPEKLESQATQAAERLLKGAKSKLEKRCRRLGPLTSAAVEQIVSKVQNLLDPQGVSQREQEPSNQKRDLKQVIESKLKQSLENLQQSLEIAPPLLDSAKFKNDLTGYIKELKEDFKSEKTQIEETERRLKEKEDQLNILREDEKKIYGDFILDTKLSLEDDKEALKDLANAIKYKYIVEEREIYIKSANIGNNSKQMDTNETFIKRNISDLVSDNLSEDDKQAKNDAYKAYKRTKEADSEEVQAFNTYELALLAGDSEERKKALQIWESVKEKKALADEELVAAERKIRGQYESLVNALQHEGMQFQSIVEGLEKETVEAEKKILEGIDNKKLSSETISKKTKARGNFSDAKWYADGLLKDYDKATKDIKEYYEKYDKILKNRKAMAFYDEMKKLTDEREKLLHTEKAVQERLRLAEESFAEIKKYQEELAQVAKNKKVFSDVTILAVQALGEAKAREEQEKASHNPKRGLELYQKLHRIENHISEKKAELELKKGKYSLVKADLESTNNEIIQREENLKNQNVEQKRIKKELQHLENQSQLLRQKLENIQKDNLIQNGGNIDKDIKELSLLQNSREQIKHDMESCNRLENFIDDRNRLAKVLEQPSKFEHQYHEDLPSGEKATEEADRDYYNKLKNEWNSSYHKMNKPLEKNKSYREVMIIRQTINFRKEKITNLENEKKSLDSQLESLKKGIEELNTRLGQVASDDIAGKEQIHSKIKGKTEMRNTIQSSLVGLAQSRMSVALSVAEAQLSYDKSNDVKILEKLLSQYDEGIGVGIRFKETAEKFSESTKKDYSDKKKILIKEIKDNMDTIKSKINDRQLKLNKINDEIASEEKNLSSMKEAKQSLQEKFDTILLETKQLAEEIDNQEKGKEKLRDGIKDLELSEAKAMRRKEKVANLAIERIAQLYGLVLQDTKDPR